MIKSMCTSRTWSPSSKLIPEIGSMTMLFSPHASEMESRASYYQRFLFGAQCSIMAWIFFALSTSCHWVLDSSLMNFKRKVQGIRALYMIYMEMCYSSKGYISAQMGDWSTSISLAVYRYLKRFQSYMGSVVSTLWCFTNRLARNN